MSEEKTDKKTLLPEFLPRPQGPVGARPAERVAARARSLLERWKRLGPLAGAAVLSVHCSSYGVVDPLPPPPGQCREAPNDEVFTFNTSAVVEEGVRPKALLSLLAFDRIGYQFGVPRVRGGTLIGVDDQSSAMSGTELSIEITMTEPEIFVDLDVGCEGRMSTKHYRLRRSSIRRVLDVDELM